ncbi:hypothetical protein OQA88_2347 [Cercophora sp. LCS_1]
MPPHTALQLAVRPLRGAALLDQFAFATPSTRRSFSSHLRPGRIPAIPAPICLRFSPRLAPKLRLFSSIPPSKPPNNGLPPIILGPPPSEEPSPQPSPSNAESTTEQQPQTPEPEESKPISSDQDPSTSSDPSEPKQPPRTPELPSQTELNRLALSARFSTFMDNLQTRILHATQTLNDLTGYTAIEAIKAHNTKLEADLAAAQTRLHAARQNYKQLTTHRASTQREVTTLLARKDTWSPPDLERFTTLYRLDHEMEAQVASASIELTEAETEDSRLSAELNAGILKRYHEEQIWSDRIRRQSTWGTWGLMGVNILLFLVLQFVAEPWRRKRLVKGVAESEKVVLDEVRRELGELKVVLEASRSREAEAASVERVQEEVVVPAPEQITPEVAAPEELASVEPIGKQRIGNLFSKESWKEVVADPVLLKAAVSDLYSERRIDLRMRDASLIALEGAVAGAAVVGSLAFFLLRTR